MSSSEKKKLLIVEDEVILRDALVKKFENEGLEVLSTDKGVEALKIALQEKPDLILLDILLADDKSGIEVLKDLRQDEWGQNALVIILTNLNYASKRLEAIENNALDYLLKVNWSLEDLATRVKDALDLGK